YFHALILFLFMLLPPPRPPLFPYTTLFRSREWSSCCSASTTCCAAATGNPASRLDSSRSPFRRRCRCPRSRSVMSPCEPGRSPRSEEHTSELQSRENLVCRLLLEKKKEKHD